MYKNSVICLFHWNFLLFTVMCCLSSPQFWSAYVPCSSQHMDAVQLTLEQIDLIRRLVNLYPNQMTFVTDASGKLHVECCCMRDLYM